MKEKHASKTVYAIWNIIVAALILTAGILTTVYANNASFQYWIIMLLGIFIIVDASFRLLFTVFKFFRTPVGGVLVQDNGAAVAGGVELALGIATILIAETLKPVEASQVNPHAGEANIVFKYLALLAGILCIVVGTIFVISACVYLAKRINKQVNSIIAIVVGAALIAAGIIVLALVYPKDASEILGVFFLVLGIYLIILAVLLLAGTIATLIFGKKEDEASEAIDAEANEGASTVQVEVKVETSVSEAPEENK